MYGWIGEQKRPWRQHAALNLSKWKGMQLKTWKKGWTIWEAEINTLTQEHGFFAAEKVWLAAEQISEEYQLERLNRAEVQKFVVSLNYFCFRVYDDTGVTMVSTCNLAIVLWRCVKQEARQYHSWSYFL